MVVSILLLAAVVGTNPDNPLYLSSQWQPFFAMPGEPNDPYSALRLCCAQAGTKVKVHESTFSQKFGSWTESPPRLLQEEEFDQEGRPIVFVSYEGSVVKRVISYASTQGRIEISITEPPLEPITHRNWNPYQQANDRMIYAVPTTTGGFSELSTYDAAGTLMSRVSYSSSASERRIVEYSKRGSVSRETLIKFDEKKRVSEYLDGDPRFKRLGVVFSYDATTGVLQEVVNPDGEYSQVDKQQLPKWKALFVDSTSQVTEAVRNGTVWKTVTMLKGNPDGVLMAKREEYQEKVPADTRLFVLDRNGLLLGARQGNNLTMFVYSFDKMGNWIRRERRTCSGVDGQSWSCQPESATLREIVYPKPPRSGREKASTGNTAKGKPTFRK